MIPIWVVQGLVLVLVLSSTMLYFSKSMEGAGLKSNRDKVINSGTNMNLSSQISNFYPVSKLPSTGILTLRVVL